MKRIVLNVLDASLPALIGLVLLDFGWDRTGWALIGAGITLALIALACTAITIAVEAEAR
jgi:hypothetical protein